MITTITYLLHSGLSCWFYRQIIKWPFVSKSTVWHRFWTSAESHLFFALFTKSVYLTSHMEHWKNGKSTNHTEPVAQQSYYTTKTNGSFLQVREQLINRRVLAAVGWEVPLHAPRPHHIWHGRHHRGRGGAERPPGQFHLIVRGGSGGIRSVISLCIDWLVLQCDHYLRLKVESRRSW